MSKRYNFFTSNFQLWQAFVGVKARRVDNYYQDLLASETNAGSNEEQNSMDSDGNTKSSTTDSVSVPEKWKGQIEKVFHYFIYITYVFSMAVHLFEKYCQSKFLSYWQ